MICKAVPNESVNPKQEKELQTQEIKSKTKPGFEKISNPGGGAGEKPGGPKNQKKGETQNL